MAEALLGKRKFIVSLGDSAVSSFVTQSINELVDNSSVIVAEDGRALLNKIENDPPHVVVLRDSLAKMTGYEVVDAIPRALSKTVATIFLNEIPERFELADQVATGQMQFVSEAEAAAKFAAALSRAMNWLSRGNDVEFALKFLAAGEYLMRQGEVAESVYILKSGHMKAFLNTGVVTHGVLLGEIEEKEFVGEMAYINGDVRSADVIADTDCELIEIPIPYLDRLLFQKPAWAKALMKTLSKRMKAANADKADD